MKHRRLKRLIIAVINLQILLLLSLSSKAAGDSSAEIENYRTRVHKASSLSQNFLEELEATGYALPLDEVFIDALRDIKSLMPKQEKLKTQRGEIVIDNSHVHFLADKISESQSAVDLMNFSSELAAHIASVESAISQIGSHDSITPDQDKEKVAKILEQYDFKKSEKKELTELEKTLNKLLNSLFSTHSAYSPGESRGMMSDIAVIALALLLIFSAGFLLYRFWKGAKQDFIALDNIKSKPNSILGEAISQDQSMHSLMAEAEKLAASGDFRQAVRKAYIGLLLELANRGMLELAPHKTNRDYLRNLARIGPRGDFFKKATFDYELYWYGKSSVSISNWQNFKKYLEDLAKGNA
ncbi:MAG TPA: DUF4129 domain-containing protein [Pyrinomonadaceae bacterium]|nr:DUF4129 domain-containing protein [Pyrinomonadaceae bacterium]